LRAADLTNNQSNFSRDFCQKHKGWLAYQKHKGRDFSISAAISCLAHVEYELGMYQFLDEISLDPLIEEIDALSYAEKHLRQFLAEHKISEVKSASATI